MMLQLMPLKTSRTSKNLAKPEGCRAVCRRKPRPLPPLLL